LNRARSTTPATAARAGINKMCIRIERIERIERRNPELGTAKA
jgi:hypothetical protein